MSDTRSREHGVTASSTRPRERRGARGLRVALQSLLLASIALFFLNLNILGTAGASRRFSQDLVYAWFGDRAWLYPRQSASAPLAATRSRVMVVMIDERALALRGVRWPVPLPFHAQLLAELAVLRPRAILLDFLLLDPAPQADRCALLRVASRLRQGGTALYLAVTGPADLALLRPEDCRDAAGRVIHAERVFTPVSVRREVDGSDFVNRRYPFEQRGEADAPGSGIASAAVHMYCDATRRPAACLARLTEARATDAGFELAWSPRGDPFNQHWSRSGCLASTSPLQAILNRPVLPRASACPPTATLFASALLDPEEDPTLGSENQTLFALAEGSFVLIGGNFRGSGDLMTTPLHTLLPGVYYHAAALENLLAFHGRPKVRKEFRSPRLAFYAYDLLVLWMLAAIFLWRQRLTRPASRATPGPFELSRAARGRIVPLIARYPTVVWIPALALLLLLLATFQSLQLIAVTATIAALVTLELRVAPRAEIRVRARALLLYLAALCLSLVVIAAAITVGYRWLRLPPGDWLGYISFAAFGFFVAYTALLEFGMRVDELYRAHRGGRAAP